MLRDEHATRERAATLRDAGPDADRLALDRRPGVDGVVDALGERDRLELGRLEDQRLPGADRRDEDPLPILRDSELSGVEQVDVKRVAKSCHGICPRRVEDPLLELDHILDDRDRRAMNLETRDDCPGLGPEGIV